jgi:hypothetical protein
MIKTVHLQPRALSLAAAHLCLVDMAVDLSRGKSSATAMGVGSLMAKARVRQRVEAAESVGVSEFTRRL